MIIARFKDTQHVLSKDKQLDEFLSQGWSLYEEDETGNQMLIADPEQGFIKDRPLLEQTHTSTRPADSEAMKALRHILYGEI